MSNQPEQIDRRPVWYTTTAAAVALRSEPRLARECVIARLAAGAALRSFGQTYGDAVPTPEDPDTPQPEQGNVTRRWLIVETTIEGERRRGFVSVAYAREMPPDWRPQR